MATFDLNVRGALITPYNNQTVHYYLILIDLPTGTDLSGFAIVPPPIDGSSTAINYTYSGVFTESQTDENCDGYSTYALPVYTIQKGMDRVKGASSITITDSQGNKVGGDPNRLHPPIVEILSTTSVICVPFVVQSLKHPANYFVVVMAHFPTGGYANSFPIIEDSLNMGGLIGEIRSDSTQINPDAAIGVIASSAFGQYTTVYAKYSVNDPLNPEDYDRTINTPIYYIPSY